MSEIYYSDTALEDGERAYRIIDDYFSGKNTPDLAEKHKDLFENELLRQERLLSDLPELYPEHDGFRCGPRGDLVRSFHVHWFICFYTYDKETDLVAIWYIRPSRSDYSALFAVR